MTTRSKPTHLTEEHYKTLYQQSLQDPAQFWETQALHFITWSKKFQTTLTGDFKDLDGLGWFLDGQLNACYNCVDRHLNTRAEQIAIIWEGNEPDESKQISYRELHEQVCKLANVLKSLGIQKGDRIGIYLPMIPEAIYAMLACARIGAIHSVIFGGFSAEALQARLLDANCRLLITADEGRRGEKLIPFKEHCDKALLSCPAVKHVLLVKHTGSPISIHDTRDIDYQIAMQQASIHCPIEVMSAADPLFILYTSGSTGKPKGVLHGTGGYLVYAAMTHHYVFDYQDGDVYWCSADIGWITGHTYMVYGPLANGATSVMFEGVPHYPDYARYWHIIDKHQVNIFYTSPTAIRALRREGDSWVQCTNRQSLKLLGTVGEPINPDVWEWYFNVVGEKRCPIVNTWWQTETGGILLTQLPGATPQRAGSVGWPFFGILPDIVNEQGVSLTDHEQGSLVMKQPWPGLMQTIYGNRQRFVDTYFKTYPGCFLTGDGAYRDAEGQYWITGRNDDVIKVSGHRIGTEEIESALVAHTSISEAAAVGIADDITGEKIYVFVTLKANCKPSDALKKELVQQVREHIGALATPQHIQWAAALPKTRSGKIMRRLLRKIASHDIEDLGDLSTLADASIIEPLIEDSK